MKIFSIIFLLFLNLISRTQTVFWTETFNNGCAANCSANGMNTGNGAWTTASSGANGATPNRWYVSCAENGQPVGTCGAGCGANATLHLGAVGNSDCGCLVCPTGDCGAAYDACNGFTFCGGSPQTNQRAISPLISTVGKTGISVSFDYIERGQAASDDGSVYYSTNGGGTWTLLINTAKTAVMAACSGQGFWTNYTSAALPAACDNIANFMISFVWVNNADGLGNDPSYAINDLKIRYNAVLPIELTDFYSKNGITSTDLIWKTATEKNSSYFEIQKSVDGENFVAIGKVQAARNSYSPQNYFFNDAERLSIISYYRLKMVDIDNTFHYSNMIAVDGGTSLGCTQNYFLNKEDQIEINKNFAAINGYDSFSILNPDGKLLASYNLGDYSNGDKILIPVQNTAQGIYLGQLKGYSAQKSFKFFVSE